MERDDESEIFEAALDNDQAPAEPEIFVPDSSADQLVSSAISNMQREQGSRELARAYRPPPPARREQPQPPQQQTQTGMSPDVQGVLGELREERRARQALERELREMRNPRQPETPFAERVFQDPENSIDGRVRQHLDPLQQDLQTRLVDYDFRLARVDHGKEVFDAAYQAWFAQVGDPSRPDPQTYWAIMNSPSPGEALVSWYQNKPENMREQLRREILAEYGFEPEDAGPAPRPNGKSNGGTPRAPNGQFTAPRHEVRLPPATSRMGHSSKSSQFSPEDGSEEAIFDFGRAKPERR